MRDWTGLLVATIDSGRMTHDGAQACRDLWVSVLETAWLDATGSLAMRDGSTSPIQAQREAREWFSRAGKDYRMVCTLAGLDPDVVRDRFKAGVWVKA